jgi:hypothetical protein
VVGNLYLKRRYAEQSARRSPNLSREIGQRGEVVAQDGAGAGEALAGELHAIARVTRKANDHMVQWLSVARRARTCLDVGHGF